MALTLASASSTLDDAEGLEWHDNDEVEGVANQANITVQKAAIKAMQD